MNREIDDAYIHSIDAAIERLYEEIMKEISQE